MQVNPSTELLLFFDTFLSESILLIFSICTTEEEEEGEIDIGDLNENDIDLVMTHVPLSHHDADRSHPFHDLIKYDCRIFSTLPIYCICHDTQR